MSASLLVAGQALDVLAVDADRVGAGPLGLLVVSLMIAATVLLVRSMNARLRRLPRDFPQDEDGGRRDERGPAAQEPPGR